MEKLYAAAVSGDLEEIQDLIAKGADPHGPVNETKWTLLHEAAKQGYVEVLEYLITEAGLDIEASDSQGTTVFHVAASCNQRRVLESLLRVVQGNEKAFLNRTDNLGLSVIGHAAIFDHRQIVRMLLKYDVTSGVPRDRNSLLGKMGVSLLHIVSAYNDLDIVKILVQEKYVLVNLGSGKSLTALHVAALFNSKETIDFLIKNGAQVDSYLQLTNLLSFFENEPNIFAAVIDFLSKFPAVDCVDLTPLILHEGFWNERIDLLHDKSKPGAIEENKIEIIRGVVSSAGLSVTKLLPQK